MAIRDCIIYRARLNGAHISTKQRTIFAVDNPNEVLKSCIKRLVEEFGFSIQQQDSNLQPLDDYRFYISLPINSLCPETGQPYDIARQRAFASRVAKMLKFYHHRVFSPFSNGLAADAPISSHMRADYRGLLTCDAICLCPGWQYSNGCKHEFLIASDLRMKIFICDEHLNITPLS